MSYQSHNGIAQRVQQTLHPTQATSKTERKRRLEDYPFLFTIPICVFLFVVTN
jgi:hypothetical protein